MVIVVGSIARCIIFGVPRLPIRPCDEQPPAMYGQFCLVPRVSVHDRYYCILKLIINLSGTCTSDTTYYHVFHGKDFVTADTWLMAKIGASNINVKLT